MPGFDDELMTVAEIAAILKLSQRAVRNWIDAGTLPSVRLGQRRVRVYRSDFDKLVAQRQTAQPLSSGRRSGTA